MKRILDVFNPQLTLYIDEILQDQMNIQILVTGRVGAGKSTLVNGLLGETVSEARESVKSVTHEVVKGRVIKNGILINICDTPGLDDPDVENDNMLQNVRQNCGEIDLLLFCVKMSERIVRMDIEDMTDITRIFGIDIWKKAMFVLTFSNTYKPDQKELYFDRVQEWTQELKMRISKIIGPELGKKVPVIPAGHTVPDLPDRASWISELWIQGFRRMGFWAMVKLYIISQERTTKEMKLSQEMYTTPEEQPLIACYNTTEEAIMSEFQMHVTGLLVAFIIGHAIESTATGSAPAGVMPFIGACLGLCTAKVVNYFGWSDEKEIVDCHEKAIVRSLILAFIEEYPEYVNDDTYQKAKDELDFKTVTKEEL